MAGQGYAEFVTHDNKAPLIKIMAAFLMCLIILCTFARTLTKIFLTTGLKTDDWLAVAATVRLDSPFPVAFVVLTSWA